MLIVDIQKKIKTENGEQSLIAKASFESNKIIGIFGGSGQGKSTLFNLIAGVRCPDQGEIKFGDDVWFDEKTNTPIQKRKIAYIFQQHNLFPNFNVEENITYALEKKDDQLVREVLEYFELGLLAKHYPNMLSGGQKQRVAIARMFVQKPDLVLMDEPFSGLDIVIKHSLYKLIKQFATEKKACILMVTHDIHDINHLCDEVYILEDHILKPKMKIEEFKVEMKSRIALL